MAKALMMRRAVAILTAACALLGPSLAGAQQGPSEAAKAMVGAWELSNADHDKMCGVTFKIDAAAGGYALIFERSCANIFPALREIASWSFGTRDMLLLKDAKGQPVLELIEVEAGTYEGLRPNEGRYVLQNAAVAAASRDRVADQMFGEWGIVRGTGKPICSLTFVNTAADADSFALRVKPGCDGAVTRFGPAAWRFERGQLVLVSSKGEVWRFEESDASTWRRIPEARPPLLLVRQ